MRARADLPPGTSTAEDGARARRRRALDATGTFARFAADAMLEYLDMEPLLIESRRRYLRRVARNRG